MNRENFLLFSVGMYVNLITSLLPQYRNLFAVLELPVENSHKSLVFFERFGFIAQLKSDK